MANVAMVEAVTMALAWEMANDDSVVVLGEDVGNYSSLLAVARNEVATGQGNHKKTTQFCFG